MKKQVILFVMIYLMCMNSFSQEDLYMGIKKIYWSDGGVGGLNEIRSYKVDTYNGELLLDTDYSHITLNAGNSSSNHRMIKFKIGTETKAYFNITGLNLQTTPVIFTDGGVGGKNEIKSYKLDTYNGEWLFDTDYSHIVLNAGDSPTNNRTIEFRIGGEVKAKISQSLFNVCGNLRANEVKVNLEGCDFVFDKDYQLLPLFELENFIKENKRLPEIESAKEMENNGTNLGELNSKLLQKIEELTLYTIAQQKEIENLKKQNAKLSSQNKKIEELEEIVKRNGLK
jgi:hypothetical protein